MATNDNHSVTVLQRQLFSELVDYARRLAQVDLPGSSIGIVEAPILGSSLRPTAPQQQQHLCRTAAKRRLTA